MKIEAKVLVKLVNALNKREHWAVRMSRAKAQRAQAALAMRASAIGRPLALQMAGGGLTITITRRGGRRMDDDGLTASAKHVRDGVADWLGIDDGDPRLTWVVRQDGAPRGKHWVDIEVTA